jgi:DNA invertase Pin-like site-specific DNA recombinase
MQEDTMADRLLVPAAQYLRMSTEHQQYSLENQSATILNYAESHGFEVVRTYSDSAKRGLVLRHRQGLQQLLRDVVSGTQGYRVILVYDVSRWGRFQDTDEAAHYEFICKVRRRSSALLR